MSARQSPSESTLSGLHGIGGADLALRYRGLNEHPRASLAVAEAPRRSTAMPASRRLVYVNGMRISNEEVTVMERAWGTNVVDGRYWYDEACGAWGIENGPCAGFIEPGIRLGGPLMANASGGGTGVFLNGRELHPQDVLALTHAMPVWPGRYWVDAAGNVGWEGAAPLGNLAAAMQMPGSLTGRPRSASGRTGPAGGDGNNSRI